MKMICPVLYFLHEIIQSFWKIYPWTTSVFFFFFFYYSGGDVLIKITDIAIMEIHKMLKKPCHLFREHISASLNQFPL